MRKTFMVDLREDSTVALHDAMVEIGAELKDRKRRKHYKLANEAVDMGDPNLAVLAAAMIHSLYGEKIGNLLPCEYDKLGYYLAQHRLLEVPADESKDSIRRRVLSQFDATDYVFATTHYDECHDGYFFRRS